MNCIFCLRPYGRLLAMTVLRRSNVWERVVATCCADCSADLDAAGLGGRLFVQTGERWFAGHGVGRPYSTAAAAMP